ncbi:ArsR/SmtB family transcription factor [Allofournierella massiliensis]|uniref:DNA-binding transcriptional ArsR family regulator n=1 Tax=Allofournierella massiliensis TaxID=1650663 RepID=A0A4R1R733_9FIRM|nr:metalloregulator ArsR/SmtB family transcription factor [Fournierella massiliensis]TCL61330.1 DNA-binding transcriptional ArsR family regulator [Fournierella massiliensis]
MNRSWPREPQGRELEDFIQLFKALGDPSRMKILFQIGSSEACVSEIAGRLNMSESAVSHHLHILRMNGMVHRRRKGKTIYYILKDDHVRWMIAQGCEHIRKL